MIDFVEKFEGKIQANLDKKILVDLILKTEKSYMPSCGAVATFTGERTSRSPKDRFIVLDERTKDLVHWGDYNQQISIEKFDNLLDFITTQMAQNTIYSVECVAGQDDTERMDLTVYTTSPSQALFSKIMFRDATKKSVKKFNSQYTIFAMPDLHLDSKKFGINSDVFIGIDISRKIVVVVGTGYVCEIKKAMFSIFNFEKPLKGVLSMHCSCNADKKGKNSALFFGLSGTGKTTLSSSPGRFVVGDDEHCWNDKGIFNIEDGCYAKVFELDATHDPDIFQAIRDGAMIENVPQDEKGEPNYFDGSITENMRAAYPLTNLKNVISSGKTTIPNNIFFLTADSTGVFPPISKLTGEQIIYYFLNGFTSKMKGAEGKTAEPTWTFSPCFGAPFMPLDIYKYAELLKSRVENINANVWLVNTGWTGGKYGVGTRIKLKDTRLLVDTAINGGFDNQEFEQEPYFGLSVPKACEGLSSPILMPAKTWESEKEYAKNAQKVKDAFAKNCKLYEIKDINK